MKYLEDSKNIPFSERRFKFELTGAEVAVLKILTGFVSGSPIGTLRQDVNSIWETLEQGIFKNIPTDSPEGDNPVTDCIHFKEGMSRDDYIALLNATMNENGI